jgi:hypothetical protein
MERPRIQPLQQQVAAQATRQAAGDPGLQQDAAAQQFRLGRQKPGGPQASLDPGMQRVV